MVNFTDKELKYIGLAFDNILNSNDKIYIRHREHLDADTLKDMRFITMKLYKVNEDEKTNKLLQDTAYYAFGMWAYVDAGILTGKELLEEFKNDGSDDEIYCSLFDKVMAAC